MLLSNKTPIDLNVTIRVFNKEGKLVQSSRFKNTATERMTKGIALFLAGDYSTQIPGKWRPNFMSFGTTGIDLQPYGELENAFVRDPIAFENTNPPEGERTRPWFYSKRLGERVDGFWDPNHGWVTEYDPTGQVYEMFQGELACPTTSYDDTEVRIGRAPILRAEVTSDVSYDREAGENGYSTDCIFFGYSSVKWSRQFFESYAGINLKRLAISEFGLYEGDVDDQVNQNSLMAGFRVPRVEDIVYVEPDWVTLVEWRVTIRAVMPYEEVAPIDPYSPTGITMNAELNTEIDRAVDLRAFILGPVGVSQETDWNLSGAGTGTHLDILPDNQGARLILGEGDSSPVVYVTASSHEYRDIHVKTAIVTGLIGNVVTGIAISLTHSSTIDREYGFLATVLGKGEHYDTSVSWELTSEEPHSEGTELIPDPDDPDNGNKRVLHISADETVNELRITATSASDERIQSVAVLVQVDMTTGSYIVTDFSIMTD